MHRHPNAAYRWFDLLSAAQVQCCLEILGAGFRVLHPKTLGSAFPRYLLKHGESRRFEGTGNLGLLLSCLT